MFSPEYRSLLSLKLCFSNLILNVSNVKKQVLITHGKYGNAQINSLIFYIFAAQFREMPIPKESRKHPEGIPKEQD